MKKIKINIKGVAFLIALLPFSAFLIISLWLELNTFIVVISLSFTFIITYFVVNTLFRKWIFSDIIKMTKLLKVLQHPEGDIGKMESDRLVFQPHQELKNSIYQYVYFTQKELDRLRKTDDFRREFVANVSHELKTPIFSAQGYIDTLIDGAIKDDKVSDVFLSKAAKNLENLDILLNDLLILSQVESGNIDIKIEKFDIKKMIKQIIENIEVIGLESKKRVRFEKSDIKQVYVFGDRKLIYQVMQNLLSNSLKYTKSGGLIEVGFVTKENEVVIFVRDNGIGIPKKELNRIFERFYRIEKSRSRDMGGTGLGLSIVKHILDAHNSKMLMKSQEGIGTIASFALKSK